MDVEETAALASGAGGRRVTRLESVAVVWKRPLPFPKPPEVHVPPSKEVRMSFENLGWFDEFMLPICSLGPHKPLGVVQQNDCRSKACTR